MKYLRPLVATVGLGLFAAALSTAAVAAQPAPPVTWLVNAGYSPTVGTTKDYLQGGWIIGGGVVYQFQPASPFALQFDLAYSDYNATHNLINLANSKPCVTPCGLQIDGGRGDVWQVTMAGRFSGDLSPAVRGYGLLGIGAYHRYVELTQTALGTGYICDPWWGFCYPGVVAGDVIVANKSQTKFGWNVGLGLEFPLSYGGAWFLEVRYHWITGDKQTEFVPIQIGYRF